MLPRRAPGIDVSPLPPPLEPGSAARRRGRLRGALGFCAVVLLPLAVIAAYLWLVVADQYASTASFSVQREEPAPAMGMLAGLAGLTQGSSSDTDILYDFLESQELAARIDRRFDLAAIYPRAPAPAWPDPVFTLAPDARIEERHALWLRMLSIDYDQQEGVIALTLRAGDPATAQRLAQAVIEECTSMINALSGTARADAMASARSELALAEARLRKARQDLTGFRLRHQIVDPSDDVSSQMGVIDTLNEELAALQVEIEMLRRTTRPDDPRIAMRQEKLSVLQERIASERTRLGVGADGYPAVVAAYEGLEVDREFAEQGWLAARSALDAARLAADRQSRYLATHVPPSLAETAQYPQRWRILAVAGFLLALGWSVARLVSWSVREGAG
ncbi:sugar transporter [Frigidibacter sp. MR17.24]|uniref:sugar transporter n=1 Tax=Frigidibacter sp. MR17.24 TaxID=3127345 RepID=UPI003012CE96